MTDLLYDIEDYKTEISENFITMSEKICNKALDMEGFVHNCEISLSLVSNEEIKGINKKFRKKDVKTDVLSFPLNTREEILKLVANKNPQYIVLGDIIISFEQGKKQAKEYNHSLERELLYLVCHSIWHLLGYDHITEEEKKLMREKEESVLMSLGITRDF